MFAVCTPIGKVIVATETEATKLAERLADRSQPVGDDTTTQLGSWANSE
jgi:hypothetical protein